MENMLPCHPKNLPKLENKTVLAFPITVSIAVPVENLNFFQVVKIRFILFYVILFVISAYNFFILDKQNFLMALSISGFWALAETYKNYQAFKLAKGKNDPNLFVHKNLTWKTIPILLLNENEMVFQNNYFFKSIASIQYKDIETIKNWYLSGNGYSRVFNITFSKNVNLTRIGLLKANARFGIDNKFLIVNDNFLTNANGLKNLILKCKNK